MSCDHTALSPQGTAVISSFPAHGGETYYYASCCRCQHVLTDGLAQSGENTPEQMREKVGKILAEQDGGLGKIPGGER